MYLKAQTEGEIPKKEYEPPTVNVDSVLITLVIKSRDDQYLALVVILGAYMSV